MTDTEKACIFCKHHELVLGKAVDGLDGVVLISMDGCLCRAEHHNEHETTCSIFDANMGECEYFEGEEQER